MLGDGPIFESQGAAMEVGDCEAGVNNIGLGRDLSFGDLGFRDLGFSV